MTTFPVTGASCHTTFNCMKNDIQTQLNKIISLLLVHCNVRKYPYSTEIDRKHFRNITWKYCKNAKIFRNLSQILFKYCNNLALSAQNMMYAIFSKYCQN